VAVWEKGILSKKVFVPKEHVPAPPRNFDIPKEETSKFMKIYRAFTSCWRKNEPKVIENSS
jgi:hypothetical protein